MQVCHGTRAMWRYSGKLRLVVAKLLFNPIFRIQLSSEPGVFRNDKLLKGGLVELVNQVKFQLGGETDQAYVICKDGLAGE